MNLDKEKNKSNISNEDFSKLIDSTFKDNEKYEKQIIKGDVVSINKDSVLIDVGLKSEGRIPVTEFSRNEKFSELKIGDKIEVYIDKLDDKNGELRLSREKAVKQTSWENLEKSFKKNKRIFGTPFNRVKGGLSVDLDGVIAFLPGSQVDSKPIKDTRELLNKSIELVILKMDKFRGNIVVSRKAILEEERKEARDELISNIKEGTTIKGTVKNLTDYGAFIDLGGMDGLVHITDVTWKRINHPSEFLKVGEEIETKILKFDEETKRLSLGIKQLTKDPWEGSVDKFKVGQKISGEVTNISDFGAFVNLDKYIEGLILNQDLSWTKKNVHPSKILSIGEKVEVQILEVDLNKRRIGLGLKQCKGNPWNEIIKKYKTGDIIESSVVNVVDFGIFVKVSEEIDGMVHISDISWEENNENVISEYKKGQKVKTKVLEIDPKKERISLGIKQLSSDPFEELKKELPKDSLVTSEIVEITETGLKVKISEKSFGFIKKSNLAKEKSEQKTDRFAVGEKVDSIVTSFDVKNKVVNLSIKQKEITEEKDAMTKFGSNVSGASLGDILGKVLKRKK